MNKGLQDLLGEGLVKSMDGGCCEDYSSSAIWGRVVGEGLSEEAMFEVRPQE